MKIRIVIVAGRTMALIYIVEDDENIREIETIALKNSGYQVESFDRASLFYKRVDEKKPDLVMLDIILPHEDGYTILKRLRSHPGTRKIPVIMISAKNAEFDIVKGIEEGADDYIRKPFSLMEVMARIRALLRRTCDVVPEELIINGIHLDNRRHIVTAGGNRIELTFKEYELLRYLMLNAETVLSRESIMRAVWGADYESESRTVDMHIKKLRHKLGSFGQYIETVRHVGYVLQPGRWHDHETED